MSLPVLRRCSPSTGLFTTPLAPRTLSSAVVNRHSPRSQHGFCTNANSNSSSSSKMSGLPSQSRYINQQRCQFHSRTQAHLQRQLQRRSPATTEKKSYHSTAHPLAPSDQFSPEQTAILSTALSNYVPKHGFTSESLALGAREAGYLDVSLQLFPRGGEIELILFWLASRRELLRAKVENDDIFQKAGNKVEGGKDLSVDDKVRTLIIERLRMNKDIIQHWQDALAVMSLPTNISSSLCELYALSSDILYLAGDRSVDASWYTRRMSVATVYGSAEVTMTEDTSEGFTSTAEFVERRMRDTNDVSNTLGDVKTYMGYLASSVVAAGRSWGMKV